MSRRFICPRCKATGIQPGTCGSCGVQLKPVKPISKALMRKIALQNEMLAAEFAPVGDYTR